MEIPCAKKCSRCTTAHAALGIVVKYAFSFLHLSIRHQQLKHLSCHWASALKSETPADGSWYKSQLTDSFTQLNDKNKEDYLYLHTQLHLSLHSPLYIFQFCLLSISQLCPRCQTSLCFSSTVLRHHFSLNCCSLPLSYSPPVYTSRFQVKLIRVRSSFDAKLQLYPPVSRPREVSYTKHRLTFKIDDVSPGSNHQRLYCSLRA